jgi:hypothetical protein
VQNKPGEAVIHWKTNENIATDNECRPQLLNRKSYELMLFLSLLSIKRAVYFDVNECGYTFKPPRRGSGEPIIRPNEPTDTQKTTPLIN